MKKPPKCAECSCVQWLEYPGDVLPKEAAGCSKLSQQQWAEGWKRGIQENCPIRAELKREFIEELKKSKIILDSKQ